MIQINPREIAAEALMEIMTEEAYNNMTLRRLLRQNGAMPRQDRAFVTEVVNGTLRNLIYIDHVLNTFSKTKTDKMKPWLLAVFGFAVVMLCVGPIMDLSGITFLLATISWKSILTVLTSGVLVNLTMAVTTAVVLLILGRPLLDKLNRIRLKYGMLENESDR